MTLTPRETDVARVTLAGKGTMEAARDLGLRPPTVSNLKRRLEEKVPAMASAFAIARMVNRRPNCRTIGGNG